MPPDSNSFTLRMVPLEQLSLNHILEIKNLQKIFWPPKTPERAKTAASSEMETHSPIFERHIIALEKKQLVGYGKIFHRVCQDEAVVWNNMALSSICVHPDYQGKGIGRQIVTLAFKHVDARLFDICIFQTAVPGFYQRLGCSELQNAFVDPYEPEKPVWWDKYIMAYPSGVRLQGTVAMPGGGY